ncbi:MAG: hypothetical protein AB7P76_05555 [Candidatus Melainabacteria bacterium]
MTISKKQPPVLLLSGLLVAGLVLSGCAKHDEVSINDVKQDTNKALDTTGKFLRQESAKVADQMNQQVEEMDKAIQEQTNEANPDSISHDLKEVGSSLKSAGAKSWDKMKRGVKAGSEAVKKELKDDETSAN